MIRDYKIQNWTNPIVNEADRPQRSASSMKEVFDSNSNQLRTALNALIDILAADGAKEIGAVVDGIEGNNVQAILVALKLLCDRVVTSGAGDAFLANDGTYKLPSVGAAANGVKEGGDKGSIYVKASTKFYDGAWMPPEDAGLIVGSREEFQPAGDYQPAGAYASPPYLLTATLELEEWYGDEAPYTQTVPISGVLADPTLQAISVAPAPGYGSVFGAAGIECTAQAENELTFTCQEAPETHVLLNIMIMSAIPAEGNLANGVMTIGETLTYRNGVLDVNTTDEVEEDNTLPVTSAAVYTEVGNIEEVMETI